MKPLQIKPGEKVRLRDFDPEDTSAAPGNKEKTNSASDRLSERLGELQELLYAEHRHKVLIIVQGMDTSGKDGTVRHVMRGVSPQGLRVASFKKPTELELDHDYLWRIHAQVPANGEIVIFNRSHYEDVLVVRVHELVPEKVWRKRYAQINEFERMLAECDTTILKFFLHISKDEQKKRFQERIDDPDKRWKISVDDFKERQFWDDYTEAYEDTLQRCSTDEAPWFVIPSNKKWFRNLAVSHIITETLESLKMKFPPPTVDVKKLKWK